MKRFLLLMICLLCCLMLTACYQDNDPWPASVPMDAAPTAAVTVAPTQPPAEPVVYVTPMPEAEPAAQPTLEPAVTIVPQEEPLQPEQHTPGGDSAPGING